MFQVYLFKDKGLTAEFVQRCIACRYDALCLTIDTPVAGNRERDRVTGMQMPPRFTLASLASFAAHPAWSLAYVRNSDFNIRNVAHRVDAIGHASMGVIDYVNSQFDLSRQLERRGDFAPHHGLGHLSSRVCNRYRMPSAPSRLGCLRADDFQSWRSPA